MAGFSNFKSFGSGFLGSINEDTEIRKKSAYAKDIMYQQEALKASFADQQEQMKEKYDQYTRNADYAQARQVLGAMTNQATDQSQQAQAPQSQIVQGAELPDASQVAGDPTQQSPNPTQTVQNTAPQGTISTPQQGNPNPMQANPMSPVNRTQPQQASVDPTQTVASHVAYPQDHAEDSGAALNEATMTAFAKNYKHGAPIAFQVAAAHDEAKDVLLNRDKTQAEIDEKKASVLDKEPSIIYKDTGILMKEADKYGLPYNRDPVLAEMSRKELIENRRKDSTMLEKQAEPVVQNANETIDRLNNIVGLNRYVTTGGATGIPGVADIKSSMEADSAELQKDMAYVTLRNKPSSGYGRVTNADLNMFKQASPNFSIPNEANYVIAAGLLKQNMDQRDYWRFRQNWVNRYGGDDASTVDKLWDSYKDANPIFDPQSSPAAPQFNQARQTPDEFFRGKSVDAILSSRPTTQALPSNVQQQNTNTTQQNAPKVIGTWNPQTGKIE